MQIYGYEKDSEQLLKLSESCLECSLEELDKVIEFLQQVREEHGKIADKTAQPHSHYRDWDKAWTSESSDLIISTVFKK